MSNVERLKDSNVLLKIRVSLDDERVLEHKDTLINFMTKGELFRKFLEFEGLIGYNNIILDAIKDIWEVDLK